MKPILKRKIIATLVAGSLLFNIYAFANSQAELQIGEENSAELPYASLPKEKITGKVDLQDKKKRLDDEEKDINL